MNQVAKITSPDAFIEKALTSGAGVDVLNGLYDLKMRHESNEARKAFHEAMLLFQSGKPKITKDKEVKYGGNKAAYSFASLPHIEETIKPTLQECGLSYRWESLQRDGMDGQRCVVTHVLGHSESNEMFAPKDDSGNKNQVQALGSSTSYLKRYTLIGALGLTTTDDDDDGAASGDLPYVRLLAHNEAVRENLQAILAVKEFIRDGDLAGAVELIYELPEASLQALWIAPSKGGIFTTEEIRVIKSDEWGRVRQEYFDAKAA